MSSRGKKKTTMGKINREARLREKRDEKRVRKEARREAAALPQHDEPLDESGAGDSLSVADSALTPEESS